MKDRTLSFYEYAGVVVPGAAFLFGLFFVAPEVKALFLHDGFSLGELGLFVMMSYVAGHLVAAVGNVLETVYWKPWGGMPSNWVVKPGERLVSEAQIVKLDRMLASRLKLELPPVRGMTASSWKHVFMQMTADVRRSKADERAEIFNGNYGMNRGIAAAILVVIVAGACLHPVAWKPTVVAVGLMIAAMFRMHRFGVHYARTMLREFLQLPETLDQPDATDDAMLKTGVNA